MKIKIIFWIFVLILLSSFAYAIDYCYQESANTTDQTGIDGNCGLDYGGTYSVSESSSYVYINYTKPNNYIDYINSTIWTIKKGFAVTENITVPIDCLEYDSSDLVLRLYSYYNGGSSGTSYGQCYNGTDWTTISTVSSGGSGCGTFDDTTVNNLIDGDWGSGAGFKGPALSGNEWGSPELQGGTSCPNSKIYEEAIYWNVSNITFISTNLTTDPLPWPVMTFDVNVSLANNWNASANCSVIDNASWVECLPPVSEIDIAINYTTFTCTASQRNIGDVQFYANCTNQYVVEVNSSKVTKTVTADSNPDQTTNLSGTITNYLLEGFDVGLTLINWSETPNICGLVWNDTGVTCDPFYNITYCYQETANVSTACGGLNTGKYEARSGSSTTSGLYVNYTIPTTANYAVWQVKHGYNLQTYNITLPDSCYPNPNTLQLWIKSGDGDSHPYCYNGTGWQPIGNNYTSNTPAQGNPVSITNLYDGNWGSYAEIGPPGNYDWKESSQSGAENGRIFEEAIWWYSDLYITCTPDYIQDKDYSVTVNCNGTLYDNINSSIPDTFTLDANSNPDMSTNLTGTITDYLLEGFDVNLTLINWTETPSCGLIWNDTGVTCNPFYNTSLQGCYQEFANVSTGCGGLATGRYSFENISNWLNPENIYDGDWLTWGYLKYGDDDIYYVNYTIPANIGSALMEFQNYVNPFNSSDFVRFNLTIPRECLINDIFQYKHYKAIIGSYRTHYCKDNNNNWYILANYTGGSGRIYEEAMWWFEVDTTFNTTTCTPDYIQEKDYNVTVNCEGVLYDNINSSTPNTFTLDADSNPDQTTNLSGTITNYLLEGFDVNLTLINWSETPYCGLVWNDTGVTCNLFYNTTYCYQEFANVSTACGGKSGGTYSVGGVWLDAAKIYDGFWSTFGYTALGLSSVYITYEKPDFAIYPPIWETKGGGTTGNLTILKSCWDSNSTHVVLRTQSIDATNSVNWDCYDGSWQTIATRTGNEYIYEEAMWWIIVDSTFNTTTCTPDYIQEKDYNVTVNCNGTLYENINSTIPDNFTLDADSNPTVEGNFTNQGTSSFNILVNGTNWYENANCGVQYSTASISCTNTTIGETFDNTSTCIVTGAISGTYTANISCNSNLYLGINSSNYNVIIDTTDPTLTLTYPAADNTTWKNTTDNVNFNLLCSDTSPGNISAINITCYNESNTNMFDLDNITANNGSITLTNTSTAFNYINNFRCDFICEDLFGHTGGTSANISVIEQLAVSNTNLSSYSKANVPFDVSIGFDFGSDPSICTLIPDTPASVTCNYSTGSSPVIVTCTPGVGIEDNVTFYSQCNSTVRTYINNVNSTPSSGIFIDTKDPIITINYPSAANTTITENNTNFQFNISITDNNTFAFQINCSTGGVDKFNYIEQNINQPTYNFDNTTTFGTPGEYQCIVNTSDDHTAKKFKPKKIKEPTVEDPTGYIDDIKIKIKTKQDELQFIKYKNKFDRISIMIKFKDNSKKQKTVEVEYECPYKAFKRDFSPYKEHWVCARGIEGYWIDGETTDYKDLVSSSYNPETKIITYTYKTKNDFIESDSIGGLNYASVSFNFTITEYSNFTFAAYNIWNKSQINIFNVTTTNSSGYNTTYTTTTGNISFNIPSGSYTITQTAKDHVFGNYSLLEVITGNYEINTSFWQAELTVEVRETASGGLLSGATIQTNNSGISNTTSPATGSILYRINTGQYNTLGNHSPTLFNASRDSSTGTLSLGEQKTVTLNLTRRFNVFIKREETDTPFNFTESNTSQVEIKLTVICEDKETLNTITSNVSWINGLDCDWYTTPEADKGWYITVRYPEADTSYFRFILPPLNSSNVTIYLLELQEDTAVQMNIPLTDLTSNYGNAIISAEKYITDDYKEVIAQKVDFSQEVQFWLDQDQRYNIYVTNDEGEKTLLDYVIAEATTISLVVPNIPLYDEDPNPQSNFYAEYSIDKPNGKIGLNYIDYANTFINLTWNIYEVNKSIDMNWSFVIENLEYVNMLVYNYTWFDESNVSLVCPLTLSDEKTYITELVLYDLNTDYGLVESYVVWYEERPTNLDGFEGYESDIQLWVAIAVILCTLLVFSAMSIEFGMIISIIFSWMFLKIGWLNPIDKPSTISSGISILGNAMYISGLKIMLIFFTILTVIMIYRKIQKTE